MNPQLNLPPISQSAAPRTEKEIILALREFSSEDRAKSWLLTLSTLALLVLWYAGSAFLPNFWARLAFSLTIFFFPTRMFVIYHDYLHHAILQGSAVAKVVFWLFGVFTIIPFSIWKRSHDHHHRHNSKLVSGDIGPYPIMTKDQFLASDRTTRLLYLAARHPLNMLGSYFTIFLFGTCIQPFFKNPKRHWDCLVALCLHFSFGYFLVSTGGWTTFFLTLFIPFNMAFVLGAYLFYVQHNFPGVEFLKKPDWNFEKAAMRSSSFLTMGGLMRWATGNIGFHHIHHLNSSIPFYRLPEAMNCVAELRGAKTTSLHWRDVAACLKLKLWDDAQNRMIPLREL